MNTVLKVLAPTVVALGCTVATSANADNLLGLYAGAGVGESTVRSDDGYAPGYGYYDDDHHTAWKAVIGVRPIHFLGAEVEYIDFGHPGGDSSYYYNDYNYGPDSHPRAIAAFGVGYIPLPVPYLDVYGKLGAARLHTNVNGFDGANGGCNYCYNGPGQGYGGNYGNFSAPQSYSVWETRFAYGAGVQYRLWAVSIRAEYERINSPFGDPDVFSVGATWTF